MKILYIDAFSGISGDMFLGALVDLGVDLAQLKNQLGQLALRGYQLTSSKVHKKGLAATKVDVELTPGLAQEFRHWPEIRPLISESTLPEALKADSFRVFERLVQAEARVHGVPPEEVHFHELAVQDTIVDIVGAVIGVHSLGVDRIISSPLNLGQGRIRTAHGEYPVPGPAVLQLLVGYPAYSTDCGFELTTPTGAAIATTLAAEFGPLPAMRVAGVGYGAGTRELPHSPNVLRLVLGEASTSGEEDQVTVIETNIDDMNPEFYPPIMERLLGLGALDVALTPIIMKKGRPGTRLSVLAEEKDQERLTLALFEESSTLGVRFYPVRRRKLSRVEQPVPTPYGPVKVKVGLSDGRPIQLAPELEDCYRLARERNLPLKEIYEAAQAAARELWSKGTLPGKLPSGPAEA